MLAKEAAPDVKMKFLRERGVRMGLLAVVP